jgi:hypothetical protein
MRDLRTYPVTTDEILHFLRGCREHLLDPAPLGYMDGAILAEAIRRIQLTDSAVVRLAMRLASNAGRRKG